MRIFLGEVGSDQSRGILSPFMGTACYIYYIVDSTFNGAAVEVWEWISNLISLYWAHDYLSMLVKGAPVI